MVMKMMIAYQMKRASHLEIVPTDIIMYDRFQINLRSCHLFLHEKVTTNTHHCILQLESLSSVLEEISQCVSGGVVCFLPSYQYEAVVMNYLNKSGVYSTIQRHKKVCLMIGQYICSVFMIMCRSA